MTMSAMEIQANPSRVTTLLSRMDRAELNLCRQFNKLVARSGTRKLFQVASRLGDGVAWYILIALLPLTGRHGAWVALQMALSGLVGLLLYRDLKRRFVRERPFITDPLIQRAGVPLDRFSFPSGHTLHAVCFTTIAAAGFPELMVLLLPLTLLIALSRVVLGLHYPSDVFVGALIGAGLAASTLALLPG